MEFLVGASIAGMIGFVVGRARGRRRAAATRRGAAAAPIPRATRHAARPTSRDRDYGGFGSLGALDDWGGGGPG
ncbi:MAG: hypothetical protein EBU70_09265 [Actinobacteria bacterium]|nr:hypothetical protein [Actinomycetota bacterium]